MSEQVPGRPHQRLKSSHPSPQFPREVPDPNYRVQVPLFHTNPPHFRVHN